MGAIPPLKSLARERARYMSPQAVDLLRQRRRQQHVVSNPDWTPEMHRILAASVADLTELIFGGTPR